MLKVTAMLHYGQYIHCSVLRAGQLLREIVAVVQPVFLAMVHTTPVYLRVVTMVQQPAGPIGAQAGAQASSPEAPTRFTVPSMQLGPDTLNISPAWVPHSIRHPWPAKPSDQQKVNQPI